jgi:hypothetical protein
MRRTRKLLMIAGAFVAVVMITSPVDANEAEGFTISDSRLKGEKDFPPIPLQNPTAGATADLDPTLSDCLTLPYATAVKMTVALKSDRPSKFRFAVSWAQAEANDVDVYFFDEEGNQIASAASQAMPEIVNLGGLPNAVYYICALNYSGPNTGFTVAAEATLLTLYERPIPPPTPKPSDAPPAKKPVVTPTPEPTEPPEPSASPEQIATPGPNGPDETQRLVAVQQSRQAAAPDDGRSGVQIALFALTGAIAAIGVGLVAVRIRRDTRA